MAKCTCTIEGCEGLVEARGWCGKHYLRWLRHGDPLHAPPTALDRFHAKYVVDDVTGCMIWTGARNHKGYGQLRVDGRMVYSHRFAYEQFVGPIPDGLVVDHLCRNRPCVNPQHLRACTSAENTHAHGSQAIAAKWAKRTHCGNGHPFDETNTSYRKGRGTARSCKMCERDRARIRQGFRGSSDSKTLE